MSDQHPDLVGCYAHKGRLEFFPVRRMELDRTALSPARVIRSFGIKPGNYVLTISLVREVVQFAPFEQALTTLGMIGINADASPYDAGRVEATIRQFDVAAICGLDKGVLDGLAILGHDPARIFAGRVVWARPDAWQLVSALPGVTARRCAELGPVLGLECIEGDGVHVDAREWTLDDAGGTIRLTSRAARITPVADLDIGVRGRLARHPCGCGSVDPRIMLDD